MNHNKTCAGCNKLSDTMTTRVSAKTTVEICCNQVRTANWPKKACVEKFFNEHQICPACGEDMGHNPRYDRSRYPVPELCKTCATDLARGVAMRDVEARGDDANVKNYGMTISYLTGPAKFDYRDPDRETLGRDLVLALVDLVGAAPLKNIHSISQSELRQLPLSQDKHDQRYNDIAAPLNERQAGKLAAVFRAFHKLIVSAYQSGHADGGNILRELVTGRKSMESFNEANMRAETMK